MTGEYSIVGKSGLPGAERLLSPLSVSPVGLPKRAAERLILLYRQDGRIERACYFGKLIDQLDQRVGE